MEFDQRDEGRLAKLVDDLLKTGSTRAVVRADDNEILLEGIASIAEIGPQSIPRTRPVAEPVEAGAIAYLRLGNEVVNPSDTVVWMRCASTGAQDAVSWLRCASTPDGSEVTASLHRGERVPDIAASWMRCASPGTTTMWMRCANPDAQRSDLVDAVSQLLQQVGEAKTAVELSIVVDSRRILLRAVPNRV